jgi:hypothetical protein
MRKFILLFTLSFALIACKQSGYKIDATIEGIEDGTQVILKKFKNRRIINLDTTTVNNESFIFKGTIKEPIVFGIFIDGQKQGIFPFTDINSSIKISGEKDELIDVKITGSSLHDELESSNKYRKSFEREMKVLNPLYKKAKMENDSIKAKEIYEKGIALQEKWADYEWHYIIDNPNSYVSVLKLVQFLKQPKYKDSIKILYNRFPEKIKNSEIANPIKVQIIIDDTAKIPIPKVK